MGSSAEVGGESDVTGFSGLPADALPANLFSRDTRGFRIFADQESRQTRVVGAPGEEVLQGRVRQRYLILLDATGEVTLPALELEWWNVEQGRAEIARLEARTLTVVEPGPNNSLLRDKGLLAATGTGIGPGLLFHLSNARDWLPFALAGLLALILVWRARDRLIKTYARSRAHRISRARLLRACRTGDAPAARRALLAWSRSYWRENGLASLRLVARLAGTPAWSKELARLDAAVYSKSAQNWSGAELAQLVERQERISKGERPPEYARLPDPYGA